MLLQKKPSHIILHAGANDAYHSTSREILNKRPNFKSLIQEKLPGCKVFISTPALGSDNGKATLTVNQLTNHLIQLNIDIVDNRNIISKHLARKGFHLNESGSNRLAIKFLERLKNFEKMKDTQVSLKRTSLLSVVKQPIYLTTILTAKRKRTKAKILI